MYIQRLRTYCETLAAFPEGGRWRDDLRPDLWVIGCERRVVIAYMILDTGDVETGCIFYAGRDYEAIIRDDEDFSYSRVIPPHNEGNGPKAKGFDHDFCPCKNNSLFVS